MKVTFNDNGTLKIDTSDYIKEVINDFEHGGKETVSTPANRDLFKVHDSDKLLEDKGAEKFHSIIAKLLWVTKHGRPDIETAILLLSTRVKKTL
mmetsp:Transcript_11447/g.16195  ORF Transcript_11447/g.16195 Transcript_11447/m.16195 type:complete len:94 (+) Transcript_11447:1777-2058(+)